MRNNCRYMQAVQGGAQQRPPCFSLPELGHHVSGALDLGGPRAGVVGVGSRPLLFPLSLGVVPVLAPQSAPDLVAVLIAGDVTPADHVAAVDRDPQEPRVGRDPLRAAPAGRRLGDRCRRRGGGQ